MARDPLGRLTSATSGAGATVGYGWDLAGNATSVTYPGGTRTVTRAYDDAGRWSSVTDWSSRTTTFGWNEDSALVSTTYPNGTAVAVGVDRTGAAVSSALTGPGGTLASLTWGRDGSGQVGSQTGTGLGQPAEDYGYDGLRQLQDVNGLAFDHTRPTTSRCCGGHRARSPLRSIRIKAVTESCIGTTAHVERVVSLRPSMLLN